MLTQNKIKIITFIGVIFILGSFAYAQTRPEYNCYKVKSGAVKIDGHLDEPFWAETPDMIHKHTLTGEPLPFSSKAKMVWDDNFLYAGYVMKDPDVYCTSTNRDQLYFNWKEPFVKLFIDPDADCTDIMEIHVNALNNIFDNFHDLPNANQLSSPPQTRIDHHEWTLEGIQTAVAVDGTINNPEDADRGWSVEIAIPLKSIAKYMQGQCPPGPGDRWLVSTWYVHHANRTNVKSRIYGSWPVMGVVDSHVVSKYGELVFSGEAPRKLAWKMVWTWSMPHASDEEMETLVTKAKSLGFNAIAASFPNWPDWKNFLHACHKHGVEAYDVISPGDKPSQKMDEGENSLPYTRKAFAQYQMGGEPISGKPGGEIYEQDLACFRHPLTFELLKEQIDTSIKRGFTGIALDCIGYRNYHGCACQRCQLLFERLLSPACRSRPEAWNQFNEESVLKFYEKSIAYAQTSAKAINRTIKTTCHVYPVFLPDILYGHRIPVDYCGQTVSWFVNPHWSYEKVRKYCRYIVDNEATCYPDSAAAPFIGFYAKGSYAADAKTPERVREEIRIVKQSGARAIQFAELGHILAAPKVAEVIKEELGGK